jgi:HSP20 family protein
MAIVHWNPYGEMETLRNQFEQIFQDINDWRNTPQVWQPAIELTDEDTNLVLKVQLPGWEAKDLDIQVMREGVIIKGEHPQPTKTEQKKVYYSEFRYPSFQRGIKLPLPVRNSEVKAKFEQGILTLTLPKVEEVINRVVKINLDTAKEIN